jgi:xanthine dehydrogenase YagR molybdenum-binding subunit
MQATTTPTTKPASPIGRQTPRVDGPLKVSGKATYTSDFNFPGQLYAVPVEATIARGKLTSLDTSDAEKMPGVRAVLHRANIGPLFRAVKGLGFDGMTDERRPPFEDDEIRYYGQYVACAVADTFEQAMAAARAVRASYSAETPDVSHDLKPDEEPKVESHRGDAEKAFNGAAVKVDQTYATPVETHNPIELHSTTAMWDGGDRVTVYESTQAVMNSAATIAQMLGVPKENVRVISKFLGSGFGGKLWPWSHALIAAGAARQLKRPVKLVITRKMMFQAVGHRPRTVQRVRLGANDDGKLVSVQHDYVNHRSIIDEYVENCGEATPFMYSAPNLKVTSGLAKRNVGSPTSMRGPGAVPGLYALESAMNELAFQLKIDPLKLREMNEPKVDEGLGIPFSSRHLLECYQLGAEKFGWSKRTPDVGSMKAKDGLTLGWGMAGASWIAARFPAEANVQLRADGTARVATGTQDIGTGTYTVLAQMVAEKVGIDPDEVEVVLGDSSLPPGPISGGSMATGSLVPAVFDAADKAIASLVMNATKWPESPFAKKKPADLKFEHGKLFVKAEGPAGGKTFAELLKIGKASIVSGSGKSEGTFGKAQKPKVSTHSFGCHFVEVTWQPEIARLRVTRSVTVIDAGRILNPLAGRNQIEGAVTMGIGMALFEHTHYDPRNGQPLNSNLADYVVAVNADVPRLEVHFLDCPDLELNPLGARGIGEIGLAGVAAAITDAVHHATGVRVRELPVKVEHLLV